MLVLRPGAAHGYCVGPITPASMAGAVYSQLAVRSTPASMAGPIAVRSTQFGGGICRILRVLQRQQWVEDFRYVVLEALGVGAYVPMAHG